MAAEIENQEVVEQAVHASNENAAYILNALRDVKSDLIERVDGAERRTREDFGKHELRDQERFGRIDTKLEGIKDDAATVKADLRGRERAAERSLLKFLGIIGSAGAIAGGMVGGVGHAAGWW